MSEKNKIVRKIQSKKTSLMLSLCPELLKNYGISGGDYVQLKETKEGILIKKVIIDK